jgi:hypothetical protein
MAMGRLQMQDFFYQMIVRLSILVFSVQDGLGITCQAVRLMLWTVQNIKGMF